MSTPPRLSKQEPAPQRAPSGVGESTIQTEDVLFHSFLVLQETSTKNGTTHDGWHRVYAVLLPAEIRWYDVSAVDDEEDVRDEAWPIALFTRQVRGHRLGSFPIDGSADVERDADPFTGKPWTFSIELERRMLYAQARDLSSRTSWVAHLQYLARQRRRELAGHRFAPEDVELPQATNAHPAQLRPTTAQPCRTTSPRPPARPNDHQTTTKRPTNCPTTCRPISRVTAQSAE